MGGSGRSPYLAAIPFTARPLFAQPRPGGTWWCRAQDGVVHVLSSDPGEAVTAWRGGAFTPTDVVAADLAAVVAQAKQVKLVEPRLTRMSCDAAGNVYVVLASRGITDMVLVVDPKGVVGLVASPAQLKRPGVVGSLTTTIAADDRGTWIHLDDDGADSAWLIHADRQPDGTYTLSKVLPKYTGTDAPSADQVTYGTVARTGAWAYWKDDTVWSIDPATATARAVAQIEMSLEGLTRTPPIVLPSGELWFAVNEVSTTEFVGGNVWIETGDRSRWIRARPDGAGGLRFAEIDGDALRAQLAAAPDAGGLAVAGTAAMSTGGFRPDPATGGLIAFDTELGGVIAVEPR
jgi:hypothetical protein